MVQALELVKTFRDKKRGDVRAVDGVSFECKPGEIFGVLGVNGAGKTTLLRLLATIIEPTAGTAIVNGFDIRAQSEDVRRSIGFMSTTTALYGRLTPREMIRYIGSLYGLDSHDLDQKTEAVIVRLGISDFADRLCDKLSSGQKQRVSIARTIVHDPPVMFFDEPTVGLDVVTSRTIIEFIESCREHGKTVIFSTHIMSEAERLCDRVAVVHDGKVAAIGTIDELRAKTGEAHLERVFLSLVGALDEAPIA
jgi:sodium transport system ATP-binding protein